MTRKRRIQRNLHRIHLKTKELKRMLSHRWSLSFVACLLLACLVFATGLFAQNTPAPSTSAPGPQSAPSVPVQTPGAPYGEIPETVTSRTPPPPVVTITAT